MMQKTHVIQKIISFSAIVLLALSVSFFSSAYATPTDITTPPTPTTSPDLSTSSSCSMINYGFSVGLVYCIQNAICNAAAGVDCSATASTSSGSGFIQQLNSFLTSYQYAILALSLTLFGMRILTMGKDQILREAATLLFKIGIGLYIAQNAAPLFLSLINGMNEMIGWVSSVNITPTSGSIGLFTVSSLCSGVDTTPPSFDPKQYIIWQMFDCVVLQLTGVSPSSSAVLGGMLMWLIPALFSGILGAIVFVIGITVIMNILSLLMRALFIVLASYITIAYLMIFAPVIAPLLMFHQKYTTDLFEKWVGLVISTLFQPVIVVGFLAITIATLDVFIEGDSIGGTSCGASGSNVSICSYQQWLQTTGCTASTTTTSSTTSTPTSGTGTTANPLANTASQIQNCSEPNTELFNWHMTSDPQLFGNGSGTVDASSVNKTYKTDNMNNANQAAAMGGSLAFTGLTRLVPSAQQALWPFALMLVTFLIVTIIFKQMMEYIPTMARAITTSVGVILGNITPPWQGALDKAGEGFKSGALSGGKTRGDVARSGISGAWEGFKSGL